jgi:hypothetical protein
MDHFGRMKVHPSEAGLPTWDGGKNRSEAQTVSRTSDDFTFTNNASYTIASAQCFNNVPCHQAIEVDEIVQTYGSLVELHYTVVIICFISLLQFRCLG